MIEERTRGPRNPAGILLAKLRQRAELTILGVLIVAAVLLPSLSLTRSVPGGVYATGVVGGATIALYAIAIVLIYKTNRIINFAQAQFGFVAGILLLLLVKYQPFFRWFRSGVCSECLGATGPGTLAYTVNFAFAVVLSIGLACGLAWLAYFFVIRAFANAPRLLLTVATVFLGALVAGMQEVLAPLLTTAEQREQGLDLQAIAEAPVQFTIAWHPAQFHFGEVATVVVTGVVLAGLYLYLRLTPTGVAIRASAENAARAETLGVNVTAVNSRVWIIAGALSAVAAVLVGMTSGTGGVSLTAGTLVRVLAAAVVARMTSLPVAAGAAVAIGVFDQVALWLFNSDSVLDAFLLVLVGAMLLVQRSQLSRAEIEQASAWRSARMIRPIPLELRHLTEVKRQRTLVAAVLLVIVLAYPWVMSPGQTGLGSIVLIHALVALSLLVLTGWAGQISLGQFGFAGVGGFVVAVAPLPFLLALPAAAVAGAAVALLVGIPALKLRGLHLAIMTLAFALAVSSIIVNPRYLGKLAPDTLPRPTLLGMQLEDERVFFYSTVVVIGLVLAAVVGMQRSRMARVLIGARDNELAAQALGVNLTSARLEAFAVSGAIAAIGGALLAYHRHGLEPSAFGPDVSVTIFLTAVVGGLGSVAGPILGAVYYGLANIFSAIPLVSIALSAAAGLVLVLLFPGGLSQIVFGARDVLLRRIASQHRIVVPTLLPESGSDTIGARAKILPRMRSRGGGAVFVPAVYTLPEHWIDSIKVRASTTSREADPR